jgi:hypothetical protein
MQLTPHFSTEDLTSRGNHPGIENTVPKGWEDRLQVLAGKLEEVQAILGVPLRISYGYRCPALNQACGGSLTSDHMYARAVDFNPVGLGREAAYRKLWAHPMFMSGVDQLILERGCIHLGLGARRRQQGRGDMPLYPLLAVWPEALPASLLPGVRRG